MNRTSIKKEFRAEPIKLTLLLQRRATASTIATATAAATTITILIFIHSPYLTAVSLVLKRVQVSSLTMHFLFKVQPKTF